MKKFDFNDSFQYNIYAEYHDLVVKVLFEDEKLLLVPVGDAKTCVYVFDEDKVPNGLKYKAMKFSEFYKLIVSKGFERYMYFYDDDQNHFHIDAYESFTKEHLDSFLKKNNGKYNSQYEFLFK